MAEKSLASMSVRQLGNEHVSERLRRKEIAPTGRPLACLRDGQPRRWSEPPRRPGHRGPRRPTNDAPVRPCQVLTRPSPDLQARRPRLASCAKALSVVEAKILQDAKRYCISYQERVDNVGRSLASVMSSLRRLVLTTRPPSDPPSARGAPRLSLCAGLAMRTRDSPAASRVVAPPGPASRLDIEGATHELVMMIDGLSVERVLYPTRVPPERQVALLDRWLDGCRARVTRERRGATHSEAHD